MNILLVSPFAPYRDGIASYAIQELRALRNEGHWVEVLSPLPSAAHHHLPLGGVRSAAALAAVAAKYDRVIVQFAPEMLFGRCRISSERVAIWSALAGLAKRTKLELRIHEIEYEPFNNSSAERRAAGLALRWSDRVTVHTEAERLALRSCLGDATDCVEVIDHGANFVVHSGVDADVAKKQLGLKPDEFAFVSIGFLQRHKGFDRAIEALVKADLGSAHLHIVGSARIDHPEIADYVDELKQMASVAPNVTLHQRFVSDEEFDLWLCASDAVVLPYREIWSSGVVERTRLFRKPLIVSDLPQMRDQAPPDTKLCADIPALATAMEEIWASCGFVRPSVKPVATSQLSRIIDLQSDWDVDRVEPDRQSIQTQVFRRANGGVGSPQELQRSVIAESPAGRGIGDQLNGTPRIEVRPPLPAAQPLRALGGYEPPLPASARPLAGPAKQTVHRLTSWKIDPLAKRVEELQQATIDAVVSLERRVDELSRVVGDQPEPDNSSGSLPETEVSKVSVLEPSGTDIEIDAPAVVAPSEASVAKSGPKGPAADRIPMIRQSAVVGSTRDNVPSASWPGSDRNSRTQPGTPPPIESRSGFD